MSAEGTQITLGAEQRSVARARILRAARAVLVRQGFHSTVDDIATAAGVSRRTVFRYFPTHGQLLAAAITEILDDFAAQMPTAIEPRADVEAWLEQAADLLHRLHAECVGRLFWDLYAGRPDVAPELAEVLASMGGLRRRWGHQMASAAWTASGGRGNPPEWVTDAFLLQLSGFAFHGLSGPEGRPPDETGRVCARVLSAVLAQALSEAT